MKKRWVQGLEKNEVALYMVNEICWSSLYEEEKKNLEAVLEGKYIKIEHVGSTAIKKMICKPIIDIAIGIDDKQNTDEIIEQMKLAGYAYLPENGGEGRIIFIKTNGSKRTHHIHIEEYGSCNWENHIVFRNYMNKHFGARIEYARIKKELMKTFSNNREKYTNGKAAFIEQILLTAQKEQEHNKW